ncbi:unknown [Megasphaera elsdenii CAG:570]|uniref:Uncharacterized protein n=1 Tax=Megasphaera elsdenii CAG:570 TaxID=1263087 RepID=R7N105_MEGEL|nr:unknown [Megasphaera elsdenii CAG:570]
MVSYGRFAQSKDTVSALAQAVCQIFEATFLLVQCRFFSNEVAHVGNMEDRHRCAVGFGKFYGVADGFQRFFRAVGRDEDALIRAFFFIVCQQDRAFGMGQDVRAGAAQNLFRQGMTAATPHDDEVGIAFFRFAEDTDFRCADQLDRVDRQIFGNGVHGFLQDVAALVLGQLGQVFDLFISHVLEDIEAVQDGIGIGDIDDSQFSAIYVGNVDGMLQGVARRLGTVNGN